MQRLEVGQRHPTLPAPTPEGGFFNWSKGGLELLLSFRSPSAQEVADIRHGESEFALVAEPPAVWLLYRFGKTLPWSDAPYTVHLLPEAQRPDVLVLTTEQRLLLQVVLVEASKATVQVIRAVTLSQAFSQALAVAVQAQSLTPWLGQRAYDAGLAVVYQRFPSTDALLKRATVQTKGGE